MLRKIQGAQARQRFATYDLEWYPHSTELRLIGHYDGDRYSAFYTVDAFLAHILTERFDGVWNFAHAGGIADFSFLIRWFVEHPGVYTIKARFSGSSAVFVEVSRGDRTWFFCDSFFLLRTSLRKIGMALGLLKGGTADGSLQQYYVAIAELITYNEQDCRILFKAIDELQDEILDLGGELCPTIAATAMRLFRRMYLKKGLKTDAGVNRLLREAYIASEVQVFIKPGQDLYQYDINSSFPASMTLPAPGALRAMSRHIPDGENALFFARVSVHVPNHCEHPPIPYRAGGKIWFPTGEWGDEISPVTGTPGVWLSGIDIRMLLEAGGTMNRVHEVMLFEPRTDLAEYVYDIYERRRRETDEFRKDVKKVLLNGLYGKWGERTVKTLIHISPPDLGELLSRKLPNGEDACFEYMPGVVAERQDRAIAHEHVPFAAYITARSRKLLADGKKWATADASSPGPKIAERLRRLAALGAGEGHEADTARAIRAQIVAKYGMGKRFLLHYVDTDCLVTNRMDMPTSDKLGEYKLEGHIVEGYFHAPKFYTTRKVVEIGMDGVRPALAGDWEDGTLRNNWPGAIWDIETQVKAKGFSRVGVEGFKLLTAGWTGHFERMARPKEMFKSGNLTPRNLDVPKSLHFGADKRAFAADGSWSRPYSAAEIDGIIASGAHQTGADRLAEADRFLFDTEEEKETG